MEQVLWADPTESTFTPQVIDEEIIVAEIDAS